MSGYDAAVIGGGIIGTAAASYLAEAGLSVVLLEREELAAGASGRNSGVIQHPFDPALADLHHRSLALYRALDDPEFRLVPAPAGLLLVSRDELAVELAAREIAALTPELEPAAVAARDAARLEPALAPGIAACRLATGYPVEPVAATLAFARRARRAGVDIRVGSAAAPILAGERVVAVRAGGRRIAAKQVLVAAGPWTPGLIPGWANPPPIAALWGVVVTTTLAAPPRHVIEELGIDRGGVMPDALASVVPIGDAAGGTTGVGSTFVADEPDPALAAAGILARAARFVPALADARVEGVRRCARPVSFDGRPIIGAIPGTEGLFVCSGHGPWGVSTGPASAEAVCARMVGSVTESPSFSPARVPAG